MKTYINVYRDGMTTCVKGFSGKTCLPDPKSRTSTHLSQRQRRRIRRGIQYLAATSFVDGMEIYFWTLTLSFEASHEYAKKCFSNLLKRLKRHYGKRISYVWVAEIQAKRYHKTGERVIHFHFVTDTRLSVNYVRESWTEVVRRLSRTSVAKASQPAYERVHVEVCDKWTGDYMSKVAEYCAKNDVEDEVNRIDGNRCGVSQDISEALKPVKSFGFDGIIDTTEIYSEKMNVVHTTYGAFCSWKFGQLDSIFAPIAKEADNNNQTNFLQNGRSNLKKSNP
jgi:hypothetical protein